VTSFKKVVDVEQHYNTDRLRPHYKSFQDRSFFIITHDPK